MAEDFKVGLIDFGLRELIAVLALAATGAVLVAVVTGIVGGNLIDLIGLI